MCIFYHILGVSTITSSNILSFSHPFTFLGLQWCRYWIFCYCPTDTWGPVPGFFFQSVFFLCCSEWLNSTVLFSSSQILCLSSSLYYWARQQSFFCHYIYFISVVSTCVCFKKCFYFYVFICFQRIHNFVKHFYDGCFKFLPSNSNIWFIPVLASVDYLFSFRL